MSFAHLLTAQIWLRLNYKLMFALHGAFGAVHRWSLKFISLCTDSNNLCTRTWTPGTKSWFIIKSSELYDEKSTPKTENFAMFDFFVLCLAKYALTKLAEERWERNAKQLSEKFTKFYELLMLQGQTGGNGAGWGLWCTISGPWILSKIVGIGANVELKKYLNKFQPESIEK